MVACYLELLGFPGSRRRLQKLRALTETEQLEKVAVGVVPRREHEIVLY